MIKAFAAMFLGEPHRTSRNYAALRAKVGTEIFVKGHRMEPYYAAAFALYKLDYLFRSGRLEAKYKPAKFHILLALRWLTETGEMPRMNSHDMERYSKRIIDVAWGDADKLDALFSTAANIINTVAAGNFHRDNIRTEPFTQKVLEEFRTMEAEMQQLVEELTRNDETA